MASLAAARRSASDSVSILDLFPLVRGVQTGVAFSILSLAVVCFAAVARHLPRGRPWPEGLELTAAILLFTVGLLPTYLWLVGQYWLAGVDHPVTVPLSLRLITGVGLLTSVAWFIALVQPPHVKKRQAFLLWSGLMLALVLLATGAG